MQSLSFLEIIKNVFNIFINSKVSILLVLEFAILLIGLLFYPLMNKKVVKITCVSCSFVILAFYISNYYDTIQTFINNVSTKFIEFLYFPTTFEFILMMFISLLVMIVTLIKKNNGVLKVINTIIPLCESFLLLNIIEYINTNNISFDEYSVFTNKTITSLYECAMFMFIIWMVGLLIYYIDIKLIKYIDNRVEKTNNNKELNIEVPRLKTVKEVI